MIGIHTCTRQDDGGDREEEKDEEGSDEDNDPRPIWHPRSDGGFMFGQWPKAKSLDEMNKNHKVR